MPLCGLATVLLDPTAYWAALKEEKTKPTDSVLDRAVTEYSRGTLRGRLIQPGAPGYDEARAVWSGRIDRRPAAVVRCTGAADVMAAVAFARAQGMVFSVRGGGHHAAGHAVCDGGLMIDLSLTDGVRVDPAARTARVGPGASVCALNRETQAFGLATTGAPSPRSAWRAIRWAVGGGTSRAHGLACDNLIAADVVIAT